MILSLPEGIPMAKSETSDLSIKVSKDSTIILFIVGGQGKIHEFILIFIGKSIFI